MTKEDEARLAEIRAKRFVTGPGWLEISFLLRLLDEQAARVAELTAAGNALLAKHSADCDCGSPWKAACGAVGTWINAIRARAGEAKP